MPVPPDGRETWADGLGARALGSNVVPLHLVGSMLGSGVDSAPWMMSSERRSNGRTLHPESNHRTATPGEDADRVS
ncbi:hypothetical protein NHX12_021831 [Muraenolepis orangiensis]|uniref:Uncharacterized protein n=1 Tax=Muraenolepis orangiensis TaxID=630683 RepID=A0A9Q0IVX6_9TELE|nr:hypothetical protein NHX12_021831 [Muraenolepis orangiensis]